MKIEPVMDIEDELNRVKAQRDILLLACEAVREWSAIPISHPNGGTWYFAEEVAPKIDAAILFAKNK